MKHQGRILINFILAAVLLSCLCCCKSRESAENDSDSNENMVEVEYSGLFFDSVDQLCLAINDPSFRDVNDQQLYVANCFEELTIDYYPQITDNAFYLLTIEINKYNIFYYFVPSGTSSFSYNNGLVVTVPREKEASIENIKKQFPSAIETSGSLFVNEIHSWFIPLDSSYYEISYPSSMVNCEKNIIDMIPISFNNNTVRRPLF